MPDVSPLGWLVLKAAAYFMNSFCRVTALIAALFCSVNFGFTADAPPGPFFEANQPFFGTQLELVPMPKGADFGGNFIVRGILLPLAADYSVVFDQELMRIGAIWKSPAGKPPITLLDMAQISYATRTKKAGAAHPQPAGPILLMTEVHPGIAPDIEALFSDPRPAAHAGDAGRGPLPPTLAHFDGLELAGTTVLLHYHRGATALTEWIESREENGGAQILEHFEIAPHPEPICFALGTAKDAAWTVMDGSVAGAKASAGDDLLVRANSSELRFSVSHGELVATLDTSDKSQRMTLSFLIGNSVNATATEPLPPTPPLPQRDSMRRWPQAVTTTAQLESLDQNGLVLDRMVPPEKNPWNRRVRVADLAFLTDDRAAVLTYDGDVWLVDGFADAALKQLTWHRFASGLHESLAIAAPHGKIQVATKNGVVRLEDRDHNGEADWFENFNDQMIQSQTTRSFPLDMAIGPDGSTYVTQGGIVTHSGLVSGGEGTSDTGGILKISPDGKSSLLFASGAREPFVAVNPQTGVVTASDQQGHFIPSSVSYLVRQGDAFGFPLVNPPKLTPALVWIPHEEDISSSSEVWMMGAGMGPWNGKLLHLSYGTGRLFLISPDLDAPIPQAAVIPLNLKTELPLLHARMNPRGDALYLIGFQIWGTRATSNWAIGRLHPGKKPIVTPMAVRSMPQGVVLEFATPLDLSSLQPERISVHAWNYRRSAAYGSGRYAMDGGAGATAIGIAQLVPSKNAKSVFVHLPDLPTAMQVELRYDLKLADGTAATGTVYATIHQPHAFDLAQAGFPPIDLTKAALAIVTQKEEPATIDGGKRVAEALGCSACHSSDGTTEGKVGPTWKDLFGAPRKFVDGTSTVADETYIKEKVMDPLQKRLKGGQIEMPSYRGILAGEQLESVVLYIKSLSKHDESLDR